MAALRNKRKLAAVTRETQEEHPRNGQSRNTSVPRTNEEYITQIFEKIEGTVTKKLSQEYSRSECRILGALSKINEFVLNQQIRTHYRTVPETFRNTNVGNEGTTVDDSQEILILKQAPSAARLHNTLAQKLVLTHLYNDFHIFRFHLNCEDEASSSSTKVMTEGRSGELKAN